MRYQRQSYRPFRRGGGGRGRGGNQGSYRSVLQSIRATVNKTNAETTFTQAPPVFVPRQSFADMTLSEKLKTNILAKGFTSPTPIQDQAIPAILEGRDVIGMAHTGTGKTGAFLIPLFEKLSKDKDQKVLIVTPTRELALQIGTEAWELSKGMGIRGAMIIGGTSMWRQRQDLKNNARVVIGTPGRLRDMIETGSLSLSHFQNVVLDEADRMVDIGFLPDIQYFISLLPRERQSLFFSATISGKVAELLRAFVQNPITISVKHQDIAPSVNQEIIEIKNGMNKVEFLHDLLIKKGFDKVLIFGRTKVSIDSLTRELITRGFKAASIHGDKRQFQRQQILGQFKMNAIQILLATDVASRGLDIQNVSHVINYDLPQSYEDYIHRIGRTGRGNSVGSAITLVG